ncbi:60S ribosomal protein L7a [Hibiscus syriacus]|uniref:60S ribosomal protein L7a n=1 Tax=Hibiscus syriacus TaxID=106335 RepID=A0A6A3BW44_HIBSY|nr:60S ribosomal protein L7a [Hibiscus syriacus]
MSFQSEMNRSEKAIIILSVRAPKRGGKVAVPAKKKQEKVVNPLFEKRPKQFGIGGALPPKKDLHRFVKWPKVVRIQRKKRILKQRLKVPPALNQFTKTLDKNLGTLNLHLFLSLFYSLSAFLPSPFCFKQSGINLGSFFYYHSNKFVQIAPQNKAQLVVIAHDVDPIELVVWLPALCRKMEVPYCIVQGEITFGIDCPQENCIVLCLTTVKNEDKLDFSKILEAIKANFNDKYDEYRKKWGGGIMGSKSQARTKAKEKLLAKEAAQRMT